jgi:hypothetical protein
MNIWANENPHSFQETRFQQQSAINVWVGKIGDVFLGTYVLLPQLLGAFYLQFLSEQLLQLLNDAPLAM